ncbi:MAG TPA: M18 family aminopeptidase, partial [Tissierellaceae bacterium]
FEELFLEDKWELEKGGKYFTTKNYSALVAFKIGQNELEEEGFRLVGAHTDSPGFKIKPNPEMLVNNSYLKLNTEVYGGPILSSWFDRPLSLAGKVSLEGDHPLDPDEFLIDFEKPLMIIPNLAIHMNREVNSGFEYNAQKHTLPLVAMVNEEFEKENFLLNLIAEELEVEIDRILDFELYLYATEKGQLIGLNEEFISVGKLDNLGMVHAGINGLIDSQGTDATNVLIAFDNEEVGSTTKQGAASPMVKNILKRISLSLGKDEEEFLRALERSFMISADQAHAIHPNFTEKADPTNQPIINEGPVIKMAANQAYTTDSTSGAIYEYICRLAKVPVQRFTNRSDARGGSTIGPISSTQLNISSVDIGNALLGMHSVRELGGVKDQYYVYQSFIEFFDL